MPEKPFSVAAFRRAWSDPALTNRDIAKMFGVSLATVGKRAQHLRLPCRPAGPKKRVPDSEVLRLHELGMSLEAIGSVLGLHWQTVFYRLKRAGAPSRGSGARSTISAADYLAVAAAGKNPAALAGRREASDELLLRLYRFGVHRREIAQVIGCEITTVSKRARELGAPPRRQGGKPRTLAEFRESLVAAIWAAEVRRAG